MTSTHAETPSLTGAELDRLEAPLSAKLEHVSGVVSGYMDDIVKMFKPGVKIAVMVRTPEHPDRDFMMTDDTLDDLTAMIERRRNQTKQA